MSATSLPQWPGTYRSAIAARPRSTLEHGFLRICRDGGIPCRVLPSYEREQSSIDGINLSTKNTPLAPNTANYRVGLVTRRRWHTLRAGALAFPSSPTRSNNHSTSPVGHSFEGELLLARSIYVMSRNKTDQDQKAPCVHPCPDSFHSCPRLLGFLLDYGGLAAGLSPIPNRQSASTPRQGKEEGEGRRTREE